jgi:hypothetical protein
MPGCEHFEVEIEKRVHGALEGAGRAGLDAHLAGCAGCRAYEARARSAEAAMHGEASAAARAVDWAGVERAVRRWRRRNRVLLGATLGTSLGALAVLSRRAGGEGRPAAVTIAAGVAVLLLALAAAVRLLLWGAAGRAGPRGMDRAAPGEVLSIVRADLRRRARLLPLVAAVVAVQGLFLAGLAIARAEGGRTAMALGIAAAVSLGAAALVLGPKRAAVRRDLAALEGALRR